MLQTASMGCGSTCAPSHYCQWWGWDTRHVVFVQLRISFLLPVKSQSSLTGIYPVILDRLTLSFMGRQRLKAWLVRRQTVCKPSWHQYGKGWLANVVVCFSESFALDRKIYIYSLLSDFNLCWLFFFFTFMYFFLMGLSAHTLSPSYIPTHSDSRKKRKGKQKKTNSWHIF